MGETIDVRLATAADAPTLARHRAEMFRDMGDLPDDRHYATLLAAAEREIAAWLASGDYVGFVASPQGHPGEIVAGAGIQIRKLLPRPLPNGRGIRLSPEAIVLNVFTERAWRRRGVAARLMDHVIGWARTNSMASLVLHASPDGRPLYERLGFEPTNEMRFTGELPGRM
ncbi:MAG TPA: GNAT family N-acetyltransferase [Gemmatimonadales bacterium]|jgi:GNAT superfamily N-acetyltransferase